jgi:cytochrome c biogenesis protein CcmG/thiol:disulfide interchange protein DsbE
MRRWLLAGIGVVGLIVVLVVGLGQAGSGKGTNAITTRSSSAREAAAELRGAPAPLAALYRHPSELLGGGKAAVRRQLAALRGHPVVVNKWASWCAPCRAEFPALQAAAARFGKRVAFVGLDAGDNAADARAFLARFPVPYPSFEDPRERAAVALGAGSAYPVTLFYDARGRKTYVHQGGYASEAALATDIRRYAVG